MTDPAARIRELEAALEQRKAQLWKYGKHLAQCRMWSNPDARCTCGWVGVRETLAPSEPSRDDAFNAAMAPWAADRFTTE